MTCHTYIAFFVAALVVCTAAKPAAAQEDGRLPAVTEELAVPPPRQELLDFQGPQRFEQTREAAGASQEGDSQSARIQRINQMLSKLREKAKSRNQAERPLELLPVDPPEPAPRQPSFFTPQQPAPPPISDTQAEKESTPKQVMTEPIRPRTETAPISLTTTVDSLALANNLFAQGRLEMAQPIYEKLQQSPQTQADLIWIQYQLACCHRLSGRIKQATQLYRIVGSSKADPYWAGRAQWWLDYLSRAQRLDAQRQKLENQFELLKKAVQDVNAK